MIHDLVDRLIPWLDDWLHRFGWRSDRICWMAEVTYSWGPARFGLGISHGYPALAGAVLALVAQFNQTYVGNSIAIGQSAAHAINHTKVILVDGIFFVSGSTNWSAGGEQKQNNELTVRDSAVACTEAATELNIIHSVMLAQMHPGIVNAANAALPA